MKENDYIIAREKDKKPFLMQVSTVDESSVAGVLEVNKRKERSYVEVSKKDVITNLGKNPVPGTVYGIDVSNLYRKAIDHEWWGPVFFYVKPEPTTLKVLRSSLDRTAERLESKGFSAFTDTFDFEIRAKKGKYAGMYKHSASSEVKSIVWLAPDWAQGSGETMDNVLYHEFGHVIRYQGLSSAPALRQKWLRLYQESIKPVVIDTKTLNKLWKNLTAEKDKDDGLTFTGAVKQVVSEDEDLTKAAQVLAKYFKAVHHLGSNELNLAWEANDVSYLSSLWPKNPVDSSDLAPVITEYATKNVEELFAECFALYMTKKKLPTAYADLLEKSLNWAKKNVGN